MSTHRGSLAGLANVTPGLHFPFTVSDVVIANPVINSPFHEPERHVVFGDTGITNEIVEGRRHSYFQPIAKPSIPGAAAPPTYRATMSDVAIANPVINWPFRKADRS